MKAISDVLFDASGQLDEDLNMEPAELSFYKFATMTSVDVESSFSRFKNILSDRFNTSEVNFKKLMISNWFYTRKI